ncbi:MAG: hypothetical protein ACI8UO_002828 [Verrucomicrobiales bacterium]|jgi:hypothetical protein
MRSILALTIFALSIFQASAVDQSDPLKVAEAYWNALTESDYAAAAELFDPKALKGVRELMSIFEDSDNPQIAAAVPQLFGEGATAEMLAAMSDVEFFEKFLGTVMGLMGESVDFEEMKVLGGVDEGKDIRHIVTRMTVKVEELKMGAIEVVSLRNVDGKWSVMLKGEIEAMAKGLRERFDAL